MKKYYYDILLSINHLFLSLTIIVRLQLKQYKLLTRLATREGPEGINYPANRDT